MTELKKKLEEMRNGKILNKKQIEFLQKICKKLKNFEIQDVDFLKNDNNGCYMTFQLIKDTTKKSFIGLYFTHYYFINDTESRIELISKVFSIKNSKIVNHFTTYSKFENEKELDKYFFLIK